jgi:hypothetical protein
VTIILVLNAYSTKTINDFTLSIQNSISESVQELKINLANIKATQKLTTNFVLSAFIVVIILGVWSLWY